MNLHFYSVCKPCHDRISTNFGVTIFVEIQKSVKSAKFVVLQKGFLRYHMEGNFGGCKLWQNGKENIIVGIHFGSFIKDV